MIAISTAKTLQISEHPFFFEKEYKDTVQAGRDLKKLLHFSICARLEDKTLLEKCRDKAATAIQQWISTYKPTGQPIDENALILLFKSIDLMQPLMAESRPTTEKWLREVIAKSDSFFETSMKGHDPENKNWNSWRMAIRVVAATVLNDQAEIKKSSELIHRQINDNFVRDSQGHTDGTSLDFVARDALHYHVYDMLAWVTIAAFTPCLLSVDDRAAIEAGLNFLKPYYLGSKQHTEFVHTKIQEDRDRGSAGDATYRPHVWVPGEGGDAWMNRALIRLARPAFSSIRSWTQSYVDPEYDASDKFLAKLWGEPEISR